MGTRTYTVVFNGAGERADMPAGRFFFVKSATFPLDIEADVQGAPVRFQDVGAGLKYAGADRWRTLRITSSAAQTIELVISEESQVDITSTVTVAGAVTVTALPHSGVADRAPVTATQGQTGVLFAANGARRQVRLFVHPDNPGYVFVRPAGGAEIVGILQPGGVYQFSGTYGLDYEMGADAGNYTVYVFEES